MPILSVGEGPESCFCWLGRCVPSAGAEPTARCPTACRLSPDSCPTMSGMNHRMMVMYQRRLNREETLLTNGSRDLAYSLICIHLT
jgi:hypothetical protein